MSFFQEETRDGEARTGTIEFATPTGPIVVETPVFMPVGTRATVKGLWQENLESIGYKLILGNTYHLYLRPGSKEIAALGGLKRFMAWNGVILTDSGGYQMFSLSEHMKLDDAGVGFKSHLDGSMHRFTPESAIDIQCDLSSNIMMVLDDCPPGDADSNRIRESLTRTHRWARNSIDHHTRLADSGKLDPSTQRLFGIVQGAISEEARIESVEFISSLPFSGVAIGGLSVGESREDFYRILGCLNGRMDRARPRYLMGVGTIPDFIEAVKNGIDMFDCVLPTRNARNGQGLTSVGKVRIRNQLHKLDDGPLDPACNCLVCRRYSRGYLRHLFISDEMLGPMLMSYHNLAFYFAFFDEMRQAIRAGAFRVFVEKWANWDSRDEND
ncbi:MAG: tRNA guanosine(34) transglycosylase Tgt [Spirochaetia bacterium]|nr:tRNA guanosine(34) transglycosylase Tgt [Spirochaetia bacterium]